jgi:hypothetical protein
MDVVDVVGGRSGPKLRSVRARCVFSSTLLRPTDFQGSLERTTALHRNNNVRVTRGDSGRMMVITTAQHGASLTFDYRGHYMI